MFDIMLPITGKELSYLKNMKRIMLIQGRKPSYPPRVAWLVDVDAGLVVCKARCEAAFREPKADAWRDFGGQCGLDEAGFMKRVELSDSASSFQLSDPEWLAAPLDVGEFRLKGVPYAFELVKAR